MLLPVSPPLGDGSVAASPPLELEEVDLESGDGGGTEPESDGSAIGDASSAAGATPQTADGNTKNSHEMDGGRGGSAEDGASDRGGTGEGEGNDDGVTRPLVPAWFHKMCVLPGELDLEQQLRDGADRGLAAAGVPSPTKTHGKARWLKAASERQPGFRDLFKSWGVTPQTDEFPRPGAIARHLAARGEPVQRYLLPPRHPQHIPPHVVAFDVVRRNRELRARLAALEAAR